MIVASGLRGRCRADHQLDTAAGRMVLRKAADFRVFLCRVGKNAGSRPRALLFSADSVPDRFPTTTERYGGIRVGSGTPLMHQISGREKTRREAFCLCAP